MAQIRIKIKFRPVHFIIEKLTIHYTLPMQFNLNSSHIPSILTNSAANTYTSHLNLFQCPETMSSVRATHRQTRPAKNLDFPSQ